jgi:hypothetical protein
VASDGKFHITGDPIFDPHITPSAFIDFTLPRMIFGVNLEENSRWPRHESKTFGGCHATGKQQQLVVDVFTCVSVFHSFIT